MAEPAFAQPVTGTLQNNNDAVTVPAGDAGQVSIQLAGPAWTGTAVFEVTNDNTNYGSQSASPNAGGVAVTQATANGIWSASPGGAATFRVRASGAITGGPVTVTLVPSKTGGGSGGGSGGSVTITSPIGQTTSAASVSTVAASDQPPISTKGIYHVTAPTLADGGEVETQMDVHGNTSVYLANKLDSVNDAVRINPALGGIVDSAGNPLTPQTYQGTVSASGVNHLISAQGVGKKIYPLLAVVQGEGTVNANFQDTAGSPVVFTPAWNLGGTPPALSGVNLNAAQAGTYLWGTTANTGLDLDLGGAVGVNVFVLYVVA